MNPFSDILSSTSTPATQHRRARSVGPDGSPAVRGTQLFQGERDSPGGTPSGQREPHPAVDVAIEQYLQCVTRNLRLQRAVGAVEVAALHRRIADLEAENTILAQAPAVYSTPDTHNPRAARRSLPLSVGEQEQAISAYSPEDTAEDAPWWNLKKRLGSMSIGRYSVATARLSVAGDLRGTLYGRPSDWRRSLEGLSGRGSGAEDSPGTTPHLQDLSGNFVEYYTIGVDPSIFDGSRAPEVDIFQPAGVLHKFPAPAAPCFIENVAEFIFPGGMAPLYLLLDSKVAGVRTGPSIDQYQLMQFSDASGQPTYACSIIVTERVTDPSTELVKNLNNVQAQMMAGTIITKFFKGIVTFKKTRRNSRMADAADPRLRRFSDFYSKPTRGASPVKTGGMFSSLTDMVFGMVASSRKKGKGSNLRAEGSGIGAEMSPTRRGAGAPPSRSALMEASFASQLSVLMDDDSAVSETSSRSMSLSSEHTADLGGVGTSPRKHSSGSARSFTGAPPGSPRPVRSNSMKRIRSVGNEIGENEGSKWGDQCAVITQRAYCIVSSKPLYAFLFKLLQEVSSIYRSNGLIFENKAATLSAHGLNVNKLLEVAQEVNLFKTFRPCRGLPIGVDSASELESRLLDSISFSYKGCTKGIYQFNAKLRSCTKKEFVLAVLFAVVPHSLLTEIMNHLLLEKSLLVCGKLAPLVSVVTTAVPYLLSPLEWDGVFIPLLPASAVEVLQAPVPFILGVPLHDARQGSLVQLAVESSGGDVAVLQLDATTAEGMFPSRRARDGERRPLSTCDEDELQCGVRMVRRLLFDNSACCHHQLDLRNAVVSDDHPCLVSIDSASLTVFMNHVLFHLDEKVANAINKIHLIIRQQHQSMIGDLMCTDKWKRFGVMESSSGCFQYYPQWLIDHKLLNHKFQENLFRTQHFSSFMHRLSQDYTEHASTRYFIACWIYWQLKKKTSRNRLQSF